MFPSMNLLQARREGDSWWLEGAVFLAYCAILFSCIRYHVATLDETLAWLIARTSSLSYMFLHQLHHEGHPAAWYLLLWVENKLHFSFAGAYLVAGSIAAAGVLLWLRFSPLPRMLTLLMPFTFFFQYQYAIVLRSYVLFPLLVFTLLALKQGKVKRPILLGIVAGILANCEFHMAAFAVGILGWYLWVEWHDAGKSGSARAKLRLCASAAVFLVFAVLAAITAFPTPDNVNSPVDRLVSILGVKHTAAAAPAQAVSPAGDTSEANAVEPPGNGAIGNKVWHVMFPPPGAGRGRILLGLLAGRALKTLDAVTFPVSTSNFLGATFGILLLLNLWKEKLWLALLPLVMVLIAFVGLYGKDHHTGMIWIALLVCVWAICQRPLIQGKGRYLRYALFVALAIIEAEQIGWSWDCLAGDLRSANKGEIDTAVFLEHLPKSKRVAAFDIGSIPANAYLPAARYVNQEHAFWPFSRSTDPDLFVEQVLATKPDVVVAGQFTEESYLDNQWVILYGPELIDTPTPELLSKYGYRPTHRFCRYVFFRNATDSMVCRIIYELNAAPD